MCRIFVYCVLFLICDNLWHTKQYFIFQFFSLLYTRIAFWVCFALQRVDEERKKNTKSGNIRLEMWKYWTIACISNQRIVCVFVVLHDFPFACRSLYFFRIFFFVFHLTAPFLRAFYNWQVEFLLFSWKTHWFLLSK